MNKVVLHVDMDMQPNPIQFMKNFKLINALTEIRDAWKSVTVASILEFST